MSQSHIPQPAAGAPDEVFDSVSSQAVQPVISALGNPAGPPQEIPMHTGQQNTFDTKVHMQWVPIDTIIWSVNQPTGVLLWKRPIHPSFSNNLLSYLTGIYNTWGGSLDYRFKVAGTGFHAGAIAIVRIPPNRNPEEFNTPSLWGAFEYLVIDPKTLETESVGVSDQRPIAFHYFPFREDNPLTFGGWIAMYVLIPLNTSATGSQQIAIQSFCKPGMNFQLSQLIMPSANTEVVPFPPENRDYFDNFNTSAITTAPLLCDTIIFEPDTVIESFFVANCYSIDGKPMSKWNRTHPQWNEADKDITFDASIVGTVKNNTEAANFYFAPDYVSIQIPTALGHIAMTTIAGDNENVETWNNKTIIPSYTAESVSWAIAAPAAAIPVDQATALTFTKTSVLDSTYTDAVYAPAARGESFLHFASGTIGARSVQNRRLTELFKSGRLEELFYSNVCALFTILSKDEQLPLLQCKLYREGFFTVPSTSSAVNLPSKNIRFEFSGYIARTDPIPKNPEFSKNMLIYRAFSRGNPLQSIRNSRYG